MQMLSKKQYLSDVLSMSLKSCVDCLAGNNIGLLFNLALHLGETILLILSTLMYVLWMLNLIVVLFTFFLLLMIILEKCGLLF